MGLLVNLFVGSTAFSRVFVLEIGQFAALVGGIDGGKALGEPAANGFIALKALQGRFKRFRQADITALL